MLCELVAAAVNDATQKVEDLTKEQMMEASKLFSGDDSGDLF